MATYEEYVAELRSRDPGYGRPAPDGKYWNTLGAAMSIPSKAQWEANQARQQETQSSFNTWQSQAAPWYRGSNTAQADYTRYQQQRGLPVDPYILQHAHDPAFLQRHPTAQDYSEYKDRVNYNADNSEARNKTKAEFEAEMRQAVANQNRTKNTALQQQGKPLLPTDPSQVTLSPSQQQQLSSWNPAALAPPPTGYDPDANYGATGGGVPTLNPDGSVAYDPTTGRGLSPAQQAQQDAAKQALQSYWQNIFNDYQGDTSQQLLPDGSRPQPPGSGLGSEGKAQNPYGPDSGLGGQGGQGGAQGWQGGSVWDGGRTFRGYGEEGTKNNLQAAQHGRSLDEGLGAAIAREGNQRTPRGFDWGTAATDSNWGQDQGLNAQSNAQALVDQFMSGMDQYGLNSTTGEGGQQQGGNGDYMGQFQADWDDASDRDKAIASKIMGNVFGVPMNSAMLDKANEWATNLSQKFADLVGFENTDSGDPNAGDKTGESFGAGDQYGWDGDWASNPSYGVEVELGGGLGGGWGEGSAGGTSGGQGGADSGTAGGPGGENESGAASGGR